MKIDIEKLSSYLPSVEKLKRRLSFREKLKWILIILSVYFFLYHIPLIGILPIYQNPNPLVVLYSTLTGANIGSILTLGIAPIITASIIVQILVASKIINWDIREPEDRKKIT
ncbi:MAG: preprotein translocase subunit SecY, partial [Candidatus Aenigmatarchaeota archaeon]